MQELLKVRFIWFLSLAVYNEPNRAIHQEKSVSSASSSDVWICHVCLFGGGSNYLWNLNNSSLSERTECTLKIFAYSASILKRIFMFILDIYYSSIIENV
jgi:hypothetical protein